MQDEAEVAGRLEVLSKSLIWLTAPMQQHSKSEAIGLVSLPAPVSFRGLQHAPRDGERRSRIARSRRTYWIRLPSTASDDDNEVLRKSAR